MAPFYFDDNNFNKIPYDSFACNFCSLSFLCRVFNIIVKKKLENVEKFKKGKNGDNGNSYAVCLLFRYLSFFPFLSSKVSFKYTYNIFFQIY